jgi:hypothetical protein
MLGDMRATLLLLALAACSKQAADSGARQATSAPAAEAVAAESQPAPAAAPVAGAAPPSEAASETSAKDHARAQGVLGPTDQAAFGVTGAIAIKSASKDATKLFEERRDALQACYDKALVFDENLAGDVVLEIKAGKLVVARSTLKHAELETCVLETFTAAVLPKKATITLAFKRA